MPHEKAIKRDCVCAAASHVHGTAAAYKADACRCAPCTKASSADSYKNRKLRAYGRSQHTMVDAGPARKKLKKLLSSGWSMHRIALMINVDKSTVWRIAYGRRGKTLPPKRILSSTSAKIMGLSLVTMGHTDEPLGINDRIDSTGTKRRIQALMSCGYSMTLISSSMGCRRDQITKILQKDRVLLSTAEAVKETYDRLWDVEPPCSTPFEKKAFTLAKKMALMNGWLPPMAWDDDRIDNPDYQAVA